MRALTRHPSCLLLIAHSFVNKQSVRSLNEKWSSRSPLLNHYLNVLAKRFRIVSMDFTHNFACNLYCDRLQHKTTTIPFSLCVSHAFAFVSCQMRLRGQRSTQNQLVNSLYHHQYQTKPYLFMRANKRTLTHSHSVVDDLQSAQYLIGLVRSVSVPASFYSQKREWKTAETPRL